MLFDTFLPPCSPAHTNVHHHWLIVADLSWLNWQRATSCAAVCVSGRPGQWGTGGRNGSVTAKDCGAATSWPQLTHWQVCALCCTCFPGWDVWDKRARNFPRPSFGLFGQLGGPHCAPGSPSWSAEGEGLRNKAKLWAIKRSVCVCVCDYKSVRNLWHHCHRKPFVACASADFENCHPCWSIVYSDISSWHD